MDEAEKDFKKMTERISESSEAMKVTKTLPMQFLKLLTNQLYEW